MADRRKKNRQPQNKALPGDNPWPKRAAIGTGVALVVFLSAVVLLNSPPERGVPEGTEVVAIEDPVHVEGDFQPPDAVPAGGPHSPIWQDCGFYDEPIQSENAGHSLEHGAVWITYRPDLGDDAINSLRRFVRPPDKILISPVNGQDSPVIATAWARQLRVDDAEDPRLDQFVLEFEGRGEAPESAGRCSGGVR